jgi:nucleotide-binding universal stress UspA family protein
MATSVKDPESPGRIVAGIDGSPASILALRWALTYAKLTGSATEVIVAWDWPANLGWTFSVPGDREPGMSAEQMLDSLLELLRAEFPNQLIEGTVVQGQAAPLLIEASKGADLLVVGSRGHGEFVGILIGSVSEWCATNAHCPVLVHRAVA